MRKISYIAITVLLAFVLFSCTTFKIEGLQVTKEIPAYTTVGQFDITLQIWEFLGTSGGANLFNISADAMNTKIYDAIQREIQKYSADAAVNIKIEYSAGFLDILINGFTGTILAPATAHITGTLIKYNK